MERNALEALASLLDRLGIRWMLIGAVAGYVVLAVGHVVLWQNRAVAEVRENERPEAFKSGGHRSEIILQQILQVLQRLEQRVERIERVVAEPPAGEAAGTQARATGLRPAIPRETPKAEP